MNEPTSQHVVADNRVEILQSRSWTIKATKKSDNLLDIGDFEILHKVLNFIYIMIFTQPVCIINQSINQTH